MARSPGLQPERRNDQPKTVKLSSMNGKSYTYRTDQERRLLVQSDKLRQVIQSRSGKRHPA